MTVFEKDINNGKKSRTNSKESRMLPKLKDYPPHVTLVAGSGVQFLDFGMKVNLRKLNDRLASSKFVLQGSETNRSLTRLEYDEINRRHIDPAKPGVAVNNGFQVDIEQSVRLLDGLWIPIPVLRHQSGLFANGPSTWARVRLVTLDEDEDPDSNTHRVTVAFDTSVFEERSVTQYLAPSHSDVQSGAVFKFASRTMDMGWFTKLAWVEGWIGESFALGAKDRLSIRQPENLKKELARMVHHAHYLNILALLAEYVSLPTIRLQSNIRGDTEKVVEVDMVLDVGNSRTFGILIENHEEQEQETPNRKYELQLRDLSLPQYIYDEPFESRVEFALATFGSEYWARQSGRPDAFMWPTIARIGQEAVRLASRRRGTEGATGISSPKRYLWDEDEYPGGNWHLNTAFTRGDEPEPYAVGAPFSNLINQLGEPLYELEKDERTPVFVPKYSRSSLMMFMLAEVLVQSLCQINSVSQRQRMPNAGLARQLRSINLTLPPSMPKPEREIFSRRMHAAVGLVWKSMGWHPQEDPLDENDGKAKPPLPKVFVLWDESTCAQVVYLFTEIKMTFGGRADEFFRAAVKTRPQATENKMTVASIDIGGGTTDLVINDYVLEGLGSNVHIKPIQRFRDGFKVAGDEILLKVIQKTIIPALLRALSDKSVKAPETLLPDLIGINPNADIKSEVLRQQLTLQVMYPAGLRILKMYQQYDAVQGAGVQTFTLGELLCDVEPPSENVLGYFSQGVRDGTLGSVQGFDLLSVPVSLDLTRIHRLFISGGFEICKPLKALCEIVYLYDCDVLLMTGRPSQLPGVLSYVRALLPLPPDRIIPLHGYRTQSWYPFQRQGRITDPKTTAAVGAMLCVLGQGRLVYFAFRADLLVPYSTVRYVGSVDRDGTIKKTEVFYSDVDLDNSEFELPDDTFEMTTAMDIGYRQLEEERWIATKLYKLVFASEEDRLNLYHSKLRITLKRERDSEGFFISRATTEEGDGCTDALRLKLNTLNGFGVTNSSYWLDNGSVFEGGR